MTQGEDPSADGTSTRAHASRVVAEAERVVAVLRELDAAPDAAREQVRDCYVDSREGKLLTQLDGVAVASLREVTRERLRTSVLTAAGVTSVGEVLRLGRRRLEEISGIGPQTAGHLIAAAEQVATAMRDTVRFRIEMAPTDPVATRLVQSLYTLGEALGARERGAAVLAQVLAGYPAARAAADPITRRLRRLLTWGERRERAENAVVTLAGFAELARRGGLLEDAERILALLAEPMHPVEAWEDFRVRSVAYYSWLDDVVPSRRERERSQGHLPSDLVERVENQQLDTDLLAASLRGYQAFGAKFALAQRRVIIGDEMGLGKTVQAIAVIAHRMAEGATHALVACPASVLAGWVRELRTHSTLTPHLLHGPDQRDATARWRALGGVGVASIDSLYDLARVSDERIDVLVVDEAHYAKNPSAHRSRSVAMLAGRTSDVVFLTGTVMENRVEEFRVLVSYLQPEISERLDPALGVAGPAAFRPAVAPVYLRRNAEDVLEELPELVQVDEWEEFGRADGAAYREAVATGRFMAMRRAAYAVEMPSESAKAGRLRELVEEATENGRKVVVFSYFLDVIEMAMLALGDLAVGPLTGSVRPDRRAEIVEDFTTSDAPAALVSQIQVGGVGLNLQAASVVVLCEPQLKPTTEAQAIARTHRMGQVETVQVHRLLIEDSVDEHLLAMLDTKRQIFDAYARRSALADEVAGAVDVSDAEIARRIVAAEQTRLFVDPEVISTEDAPVSDG